MGCGGSKSEQHVEIIHEAVFVDARGGDTIVQKNPKADERGTDGKLWDGKEDEGTADYELEFGPCPEHIIVSGFLDMSLSKEEEQSKNLVIRSAESKTVFFKIKVTDPQAITANPKEGSVKPNSSTSVTVRYKPNVTTKTPNLKVMVEAVVSNYTGGDVLPSEAWRQAPSKSVFRQKVKVDFAEELELEKFASVKVTLESDDSSGLWWEQIHT